MAPRKLNRASEISTRPQVQKQLLELFADVQEGFTDQRTRSDAILDNWDMFNCKLSDRQFYNGTSEIYLPYVHDAVSARKTRYINELFSETGRCVDVTTGEADLPQANMSLLESYVRRVKLQTEIMPAMLKNGDVEGQYSLYVSWRTDSRKVTRRVQKPDVTVGRGDDAVAFEDLGMHDEFEETDEAVGRPEVEVLHDADLLVLPIIAESVNAAVAMGGSVTILRRWTKARIRQAIRDGDILPDQGDLLIKSMAKAQKGQYRSAGEKLADAAGIKENGRQAQVYETWANLKVDGNWRLCVAFYGGDDNVLGCRPCPYWCDMPPVLSVPVEKQSGIFKGKPPVEYVADLQILANDTINEAADTAHFSAMPIVMTDPEKSPKVKSMVLGLAAVWETNPNDTQFAEFPELWANGMNRAMACQQQIFQTLGVNPSMVPQSTGGDSKRNQAEIANEQQVDVLTTDDAGRVLKEGILTPLVQRFAEYDHQFRDEAVTIKVYGQVGVEAKMEDVEPIQLNKRFEFSWLTAEEASNASELQQQIAGMNILKGIPPGMYPGYRLNLSPLIVKMTESIFGSSLGPQVLEKVDQISVDPTVENAMLENGFLVNVHPGDDDQAHLLEHVSELHAKGGVDAHGTFRDHISKHQAQMQAKAAAQMQAQAPEPGLPGSPGGGGQPGAAGTPPGAQPGPPRPNGPPGMIPQDEMAAAGAPIMPRNM